MIKSLKKYINNIIEQIYKEHIGSFYFKQNGFCPCCEKEVDFVSRHHWLRDHFKCNNCKSIPRERALMNVINTYYPNWKALHIHESSPSDRGHSLTLKKHARHYMASQYYPGKTLGDTVDGFKNEDLENQTFNDESFNLVITSDVMEHIYEPDKAFKEIHRTLKPGGAHIFAVPIVNKHKPTQRWATKNPDGSPNFLFEPEWHGNPVDANGSPVTFHWGYDIKSFIEKHTGGECEIVYLDDLSKGIRAEYIEIVIQKKPLNA